MERGRDTQDPVECASRLGLLVVEPRPLERLTADVRGETRNRLCIGCHCVLVVEEEADRADDLGPDAERDRDRRACVVGEGDAVGVAALECSTIAHDDRLPGGGCLCDRCPCGEWDARARPVRQADTRLRVDDDELVAVDEPHGSSPCADECRDPLDQCPGHVRLGQSRGARRGEILQRRDVPDRLVRRDDGRRRPLTSAAKEGCDPDDRESHEERRGPPDALLAHARVDDPGIAEEEDVPGRPARGDGDEAGA
jgi:hypothetical protein